MSDDLTDPKLQLAPRLEKVIPELIILSVQESLTRNYHGPPDHDAKPEPTPLKAGEPSSPQNANNTAVSTRKALAFGLSTHWVTQSELRVALELSYWVTQWVDNPNANAFRVETAVLFAF